MSDSTFEVAAVLSIANFDDRRVAMRLVRRVVAEARTLRSLDQRIRRVVFRTRRRAATVELSVVLRATSPSEAFDLGRAVLRAAVHAAGGDTVGWERLRPEIRPARAGRRAAAPDARSFEAAPLTGWPGRAASAQRRAAEGPSLPPFAGAVDRRALPPLPGSPVSHSPLGELLIDLR